MYFSRNSSLFSIFFLFTFLLLPLLADACDGSLTEDSWRSYLYLRLAYVGGVSVFLGLLQGIVFGYLEPTLLLWGLGYCFLFARYCLEPSLPALVPYPVPMLLEDVPISSLPSPWCDVSTGGWDLYDLIVTGGPYFCFAFVILRHFLG